jgi:hypothetical protein
MIDTNCLKMNIHNQIIQIDRRNGPNLHINGLTLSLSFLSLDTPAFYPFILLIVKI